MRRLIPFILLMIMALPLMAQPNLPRVYVQKLELDTGKLPFVTWLEKTSAPEYLLEAWILERPEDLLSTQTHSVNHVSVNQVGDGIKFPFTVVAKVQLGNFRYHWKAGETLHLKLKHKASGAVKEWDVLIPPGTNLMKHLEDPIVIPPYSKAKK